MSRPWVKLHTDMLAHPGTGRLSDSAFRAWVTLLMMAGRVDDEGRAGDVGDLAWYLRWTAEQVDAALTELPGRIQRDGDALTVRDWAEWQAPLDPKGAERQARYKARQASQTPEDGNAVTDASLTPLVTPYARSRDLELDLDLEAEAESEQKQQPAPAGADVATNGNGAARDWTPFYQDCGELWHVEAMRQDGGGALAWAGRMAHMAGMMCGHDVTMSRLLLRSWSRSEDFAFAKQPTLAPPKFGQWLNLNADYVLAVER